MAALLHRPGLAALLLTALLMLPGPFLLKLQLDNAPEIYFPADAPAMVFDRSVREDFPQDQVLVALFAGPRVYNAAFLDALDGLAKELEQHPLVERVMSVTNVEHIRATADGFAVEELLGTRHRVAEEAANAARARSDAFAPGALVSREHDAHALVVRPAPLDGSLQRLALQRALAGGIDDAGLGDQLAAIGGHVALDVAQLKAMIRDLATLIPGTLGISLVLLWWLFRRWLVLGLALATISAATGLSVVMLVALGEPFTLITAMVPPLVTALTVAMLMHLFNAVCNADANGLRGEARLRSALATVTTPTLFTALTTAGGLLSLLASPIRPIATFGLVAAVSTLCAALIVLFLLPALILRFDDRRWTAQLHSLRRLNRLTAALLRPALRHPVVVLVSGALLVLVAVLQIPRIEVQTDLYAFFAGEHPINRATARIEDSLSGVMPLELVFSTEERDGLKAPERLEAMAAVEGWLRAQPEVDYSLSYAATLAEMHAAFNGFAPGERPLPDSRALVEQYLLFYGGRDLEDLVTPDFTRSRLLVALNVHGSRELNGFLRRLEAHLAAAPPADLAWNTAGMARLFADQERLLIDGQVNSLYTVAALISGLMFLLWRQLRMTLTSLIPNFVPIIFLFGLMGVLGIWLDMATAMVASVAIGIAIDDTIHLLHGIREQRRRGRRLVTAIARSVRHRGRALVATTLVLCAQFLLMALSPFQPTAVFGLLTALTLAMALLFDLLVLPAIALILLRGAKL